MAKRKTVGWIVVSSRGYCNGGGDFAILLGSKDDAQAIVDEHLKMKSLGLRIIQVVAPETKP